MDTRDKKRIIVTGGAGFMGRWVSRNLVGKGHQVWVLDNLSNGSEENIEEFRGGLKGFIKGDLKDKYLLSKLFGNNYDICIHMAASINVQRSIDDPASCFANNVEGLFNVLEACRKGKTKFIFISSALIYKTSDPGKPIGENHPLNPSCPYTVSKIFGENLVMSYNKTYDLPVVILRPFSIYGPWQKKDSDGGVMSIFLMRKLNDQPLDIYGDGEQSRDFFYIEDCAEFIVMAAFSDKVVGDVLNAGSGTEVKIKDLASMIAGPGGRIRYVKHHHPRAEVMSMCSDFSKVENILGWRPRIGLEEGINKTREWLVQQQVFKFK